MIRSGVKGVTFPSAPSVMTAYFRPSFQRPIHAFRGGPSAPVQRPGRVSSGRREPLPARGANSSISRIPFRGSVCRRGSPRSQAWRRSSLRPGRPAGFPAAAAGRRRRGGQGERTESGVFYGRSSRGLYQGLLTSAGTVRLRGNPYYSQRGRLQKSTVLPLFEILLGCCEGREMGSKTLSQYR